MRVVLTAMGTLGYAQPMLALATTLRDAGHDPVVVFPAIFAERAAALDLSFVPFQAMPDQHTMRQLVVSQLGAGDAAGSMSRYLEVTLPFLPQMYEELKAACDGADLLVSTHAQLAACMVHEAIGIPFASVYLMFLGPISHGAMRNATAPSINAMRARLGFPELLDPLGIDGSSPQLALHAVSRLFLRKGKQWPAHHDVTGFLSMNQGEDLDPELRSFLKGGEPPVLISFSSMAHPNPAALTALLVAAVRRAKRRAIIQAGWSGLAVGRVGEDIYRCGYLPHHLVLPHVACMVHHGGAGTAAEALRAGVPAVVVPHLHDQPIIAQLLLAIGCAGGVVPFHKLTVEALGDAIDRTLDNPRFRVAAQSARKVIAEEHGNETAMARLEDLIR